MLQHTERFDGRRQGYGNARDANLAKRSDPKTWTPQDSQLVESTSAWFARASAQVWWDKNVERAFQNMFHQVDEGVERHDPIEKSTEATIQQPWLLWCVSGPTLCLSQRRQRQHRDI